jgi:transcriptional regulator with XRE-family HTH domain
MCWWGIHEMQMIDYKIESPFRRLESRRRELGISVASLAKRSAVSMPTVSRVLSGRAPHASFANVLAIAKALGLEIKMEAKSPAADYREEQAKRKAQRLVTMVQATSALDAQAVDARTLGEMTHDTVRELLTGSPRALWSD